MCETIIEKLKSKSIDMKKKKLVIIEIFLISRLNILVDKGSKLINKNSLWVDGFCKSIEDIIMKIR